MLALQKLFRNTGAEWKGSDFLNDIPPKVLGAQMMPDFPK